MLILVLQIKHFRLLYRNSIQKYFYIKHSRLQTKEMYSGINVTEILEDVFG